jgi:hypothetical protein
MISAWYKSQSSAIYTISQSSFRRGNGKLKRIRNHFYSAAKILDWNCANCSPVKLPVRGTHFLTERAEYIGGIGNAENGRPTMVAERRLVKSRGMARHVSSSECKVHEANKKKKLPALSQTDYF